MVFFQKKIPNNLKRKIQIQILELLKSVEKERPLIDLIERSNAALNNGHRALRSGADFETHVSTKLISEIVTMCGFDGWEECEANNEPLPSMFNRNGKSNCIVISKLI